MVQGKKAFIIPFVAAALCGLVSCGGGADGGSQSESGQSGGTKLLTVWVHKSSEEPEGKVYAQIKNNFNNAALKTSGGTLIKMNMEFYGNTLETKINASILAGGLPDIFAIDSPDIAAKVNAGIIVPIDNFVSSKEKASYVDSVIAQSTISDKLYALSGMEAPGGLYFNKTLLKSVGYSEDDFGTLTKPWSWEDVKAAMVKLKKAGKPYQLKTNFGFGEDGYMYLYSPLIYSAEATFGEENHVTAALTTDNAVSGISKMEMFYTTEGLSSGESWAYQGTDEFAFANEEIPFEIYGPWDARTIEKGSYGIKGNYGIMPMPVYQRSDGTKSNIVATPCGSYGFAVTSNAQNQEAAAIAVKYLTGADSSEMMFNAIGTFPTNKEKLASNETLQSGVYKQLADYLLANTYTRPKMIKYPQLKVAYGEVLSYVKNMNSVSNFDLKGKITEEMSSVDSARG